MVEYTFTRDKFLWCSYFSDVDLTVGIPALPPKHKGVGGWPTPQKNMSQSIGMIIHDDIPNINIYMYMEK